MLGLVALAPEALAQNRGPDVPLSNLPTTVSSLNHSLIFPSHIFPWHLALDRRTDLAALDLEIRPKRTKVYLNGRFIGRAARFDGHPELLWLTEGDHQLAFYKEGYGTVVRDFNLDQGERIQVRIRLERGEAHLPGDS